MTPASRFSSLISVGSLSFLALFLFNGCQTERHWRAQENPRFAAVSSAANNGDAKAENELGLIFLHSTPRDPESAMKWFKLSADQGYAPAQYNIGRMYGDWCAKGRGKWNERNYAEALKWYQKAAEQNYPPAFTAIGTAYKEGHALTQSYKESLNWFRQAAAYNDPVAQYELGILYDGGHNFQANEPEAYKWFTLAAAQGHPLATKARDNVARKLTAEQLDEAQQRALAFTPKSLDLQWR